MGTVALLLRGEFATSKAARVSMLYADGGKEKQVRTIMKDHLYAYLVNIHDKLWIGHPSGDTLAAKQGVSINKIPPPPVPPSACSAALVDFGNKHRTANFVFC
ncbi:hypothetical protein CFC21_016643 [Triticum aestivum]|uniref:Uncharacterized protein n=2 Tax=Triticum aestivum TaxID=4565 RepID=A0A9R1DZ38_WHEAT|nr:hypothetical protein CFC21_016642 [Triticum aestivum]KAF7000843.1 hypothetical protein CFC21_016643 [Triticum aestivum]